MPDYQRKKLDAVHDPKLVSMLIDLWYSAQKYEARLDEGRDRFEQHLKRQQKKHEAAARKGLFDRAFAGEMGDDAKQLAEHCTSTVVKGTALSKLHLDFEAAWESHLEERKRKRQSEREKRAAAAAQPDLYEEAG